MHWRMRLRYWLIQKLAGRRVVILNARLSMIERVRAPMELGNLKGCLLSGCHFSPPAGYAIMIQHAQDYVPEMHTLMGQFATAEDKGVD